MADLRTQVLVVGGGLAGLAQAAHLGRYGIEVVVVDQAPRAAHTDAAYDGRTTAIALGTRRILEAAGVWRRVADEASPILEIRITDAGRPVLLHFDHAEMGDEPFGHIVDNRLLRVRQFELLDDLASVRHLAPAKVGALDLGSGLATATLDDGSKIRAELVIGADGRQSFVRRSAGIDTYGWPYRQSAIVLTMTHEEPHNGVALEHFRRNGPFAVLPMTDDADGRPRSSVVWSETPERATAFARLNLQDFTAELQARVGDWLGAVAVAGRRFVYPLSVLQARRYTAPRLALIGEAAHAIHPIAGQGLNLGLRDAAALTEAVVDAARLGLDIGAPALLAGYARLRRPDNLMMLAATDGLLRLFSNAIPPIRLARGVGLEAVGRLPPVKRFFMSHAMGTGGLVPRLEDA